MEYSTALKGSILSTIITAADAGSGNAYLTVRATLYGGAGINSTVGDVNYYEPVLATFPLNKPCGAINPSTQIEFSITTATVIVAAAGAAVRWRLHRSDGVSVLLGTVSEVNGSGEIQFSGTDFEADGVASVTLDSAILGIQ